MFVQVARLAREVGLVKLGRLGVDGTKVVASASKHKAIGYGRMNEKEGELKQEIAELLKQAEVADAAKDVEHGRNHVGNELPNELQRRESRLKVITAAKASFGASARDGREDRSKA